MIRLRTATVLAVLDRRPGAVEASVEVAGRADRAVAYPALVGRIEPGDRVLVNTTAVDLGLGTGGVHFVVAVLGREPEAEPDDAGHVMKLRYTPHQVAVRAVEEEGSPHRARLAEAAGLGNAPVVWIPLHSMLGPVVAGARVAGAARVAHVWTDGAALPAPLSRLCTALREAGLLHGVVTAGQAFGGDLEAVSVFSGMLAARHVLGAEVVVVGDGPGNTGTGTTWGATDVASAQSLNAAAVLGGRAVAALRVSFADPRPRHRGVSHHSLTALARVALVPVHVAVPALDDEEQRAAVWQALREAGLPERHQLVEAGGEPALDLLRERGVRPESMGRTPAEDPAFFLAAGAAGVLAGRMAVGDRGWRSPRPGP